MQIEVPNNFSFDIEQAAEIAVCSTKTIRRHIELYATNPGSRYALKARRNTPRGKACIYAKDLIDYLERTVVGADIKLKVA